MIGKTISHYKILEKLGGGGMGVVYKAKDTRLKRTVALKFLPPDLVRDDEAKERFMLEAQAASALDHPNICTIYEIGETTDGQLFIAMACYEGETLKQKIASAPLSVDEAVDTAIQVTQGLAKAHEKGIVHRDIKPANIMLTSDGIAKILDFGLAKLTGSQLTKTGMTLGTIAYMSPEQAIGKNVDHRTDIWSLGVVLYQMLSGELPFQGEYEQAIIYSILNEEPQPIDAIPMALQQALDKALAKQLGERYPAMAEFIADLKQMRSGTTAVAEKSAPSIAVLAFANMSADPENDYFCDGMAEELIDALTKLKGLKVAARTSAFSFKGKDLKVQEVGKELKVGHVLEGSVRKSGNRLRITAQLIKADDGFHLWSERYDRELEDVFAIQDEIARTIVNTLKIKLVGGLDAPIIKRYTDNLEAYQLYLKGRYFWNKRHEGGMQQAMECFTQVIAKEPAYALAYAALADCYVILGWYTYLAPKEAYSKVKSLTQKALEIDDTLGEALAALAFVKWAYDWDWSEGEREFRKALDLYPNYATAHWWYAFFLMMMGRTEESLSEIRRAQELEPLSLIINSSVGWMLHFARRHDEALEQCLKVNEMEPTFGVAYMHLGWIYEQKGLYDNAISAFEKGVQILGGGPFYFSLAHTYALKGDLDKTDQILHKLTELDKERYVSPYYRAAVYVALKEKNKAFEWLEKAYMARDGWLVSLNVDPKFDGLRSDPRFPKLVKKIGLEK